MSRKGPATRREMVADPIHRSVLVTQLINKVMLHGKRSVAEKIVYDAMEIIDSKSDESRRSTSSSAPSRTSSHRSR